MKKHEIKFKEIKEILKNHFGKNLIEYEDGKELTITKTGIWISVDDSELTVGLGLVHYHCDPEYDNLTEAVEGFFYLLTQKKRITRYFKGAFHFKTKIEVESKDGEYFEVGRTSTWLFPFWKKTKKVVSIENALVEYVLIEKDYLKIMNNI